MPQTYKDYSIREICIYLGNQGLGAGGIERALEGDIIDIRAPGSGIGRKEAKRFMWLRIEGLDRGEMDRLTDPWTDPLNPTEAEEITGIVQIIAKRRYCVPLKRLQSLEPRFDITRARDLLDEHQPFLCHDPDNYLYLTPTTPFPVHGLVYDKAMMRYL